MPSAPTFKRLPRSVREQQMLDAAVKVFSRRGYHSASMDDIAEDAGISKPMVYAYLGTKESLFTACLHREGTRLMEAIAGAAAPELPPDEQLWRGLRAFFGFVGAHRDGWSVLYRQARGEQPFADELSVMRAQVIEVVAGLLGRNLPTPAPGARQVRDTDLEIMAYALVGAAESVADRLADHPDEEPEPLATRLMNATWLGAGQLRLGEVWHPPTPDQP
ncbi:TetR/AcrR family transcriptional regulator [Micromonospora sp. NBC_01699]|uniref:TetR/AcrR family transcriptional regulator n=1 Tax=Micromonospora sp. NBC_01699 TaxID=2975984 RepID=UPI002E2E401A|nr:TetR/AcrR family transcriptional regulator [Micromonospora sp. NBC_01699]